ncbi:hypothetical protein R3P38DRAFT_3221662 [Favolaschia claudopus]|uniref:Uncharacterized protein n=1 Tax=Favolaschia claudopus TaxID=2862362 RepID=A0AAV9ZZD9_9AGAR
MSPYAPQPQTSTVLFSAYQNTWLSRQPLTKVFDTYSSMLIRRRNLSLILTPPPISSGTPAPHALDCIARDAAEISRRLPPHRGTRSLALHGSSFYSPHADTRRRSTRGLASACAGSERRYAKLHPRSNGSTRKKLVNIARSMSGMYRLVAPVLLNVVNAVRRHRKPRSVRVSAQRKITARTRLQCDVAPPASRARSPVLPPTPQLSKTPRAPSLSPSSTPSPPASDEAYWAESEGDTDDDDEDVDGAISLDRTSRCSALRFRRDSLY